MAEVLMAEVLMAVVLMAEVLMADVLMAVVLIAEVLMAEVLMAEVLTVRNTLNSVLLSAILSASQSPFFMEMEHRDKQTLTGFSVPSPVSSTGSTFSLRLTSDFAVSAHGFKIAYQGHGAARKPGERSSTVGAHRLAWGP
ncbi:hypothetical protein NHX12_034240 [Muraenolepis orangiensis]|uniref:CUB domain-containing protein n=1 Tax=Muraenolepis orangiensis TaxID=630683 RepID=A0A9Q0D380_9TELE|nr:hypothetical protein NHX12_034240 [Muraenolepis orangiensis]